jgi:hypothetical protein
LEVFRGIVKVVLVLVLELRLVVVEVVDVKVLRTEMVVDEKSYKVLRFILSLDS